MKTHCVLSIRCSQQQYDLFICKCNDVNSFDVTRQHSLKTDKIYFYDELKLEHHHYNKILTEYGMLVE